MRRPLAVLALVWMFAGCQATTPASNPNTPIDPFWGRTRIEPPATGTVAKPGAIDPYYAASQAPGAAAQGASAATPKAAQTSVAPVSTPAAAQQSPAPPTQPAPSSQTPVVPRSGSVPRPSLSQTAPLSTPNRGDVVAIPAAARQASPLVASRTASLGATAAAPSSSVATPAAAPAAPQTTFQTINPRPKSETTPAGSLPSNWPTPRAVAPANALNAVETPAAGALGSERKVDPAVVPASATEAVTAPVAAPDSRYGYDPNYQWLRGKLEYSQIDKAWRLRYIPVDGTTDSYGGSVVLAETPKLSGVERGQFLKVQGRLLPPAPGGKTYAAGYEVSQIERLEP